jgi:hypothetical protein
MAIGMALSSCFTERTQVDNLQLHAMQLVVSDEGHLYM